MSVVTLQMSVLISGMVTSPYGGITWNAQGPNLVAAGINPNQGTLWGIWQIKVAGLANGETFNGVTIQGGNDFTVGGGGITQTRQAQLFVNMFNTISGFNGQTGTLVDTLVGTGVGKTLNALFQKAGFTSTDIVNGNMYLGVAVKTDSAGTDLGTFRFGALAMTFFTGSDVPNPPAGQMSGVLTNPAANVDPGKVAVIEQFAALTFQVTQPAGLNGLTHTWTLPAGSGLTFASNGSIQVIFSSLFTGSISNTGAINIVAGTPPGDYAINIRATGGPQPYSLWAILHVRSATTYCLFPTEA